MNAYIYHAALYCEDCAHAIKVTLTPLILDTEDSEEYPQGPYANGGGESDTPEHCDSCNTFLENPLTTDGYEYVRRACFDFGSSGVGNQPVIETWAEFYDCLIPSPDCVTWDRFDICLAHFVFNCECYEDYAEHCAVSQQLERMRFKPARSVDSSRAMLANWHEHENALNILARLRLVRADARKVVGHA